jgi:hypothetical protein
VTITAKKSGKKSFFSPEDRKLLLQAKADAKVQTATGELYPVVGWATFEFRNRKLRFVPSNERKGYKRGSIDHESDVFARRHSHIASLVMVSEVPSDTLIFEEIVDIPMTQPYANGDEPLLLGTRKAKIFVEFHWNPDDVKKDAAKFTWKDVTLVSDAYMDKLRDELAFLADRRGFADLLHKPMKWTDWVNYSKGFKEACNYTRFDTFLIGDRDN